MNKHTYRFMPLLVAVCLILGVLAGKYYERSFPSGQMSVLSFRGNKLDNLLQLIDNHYVDTIRMDSFIEKAMPLVVSELDPHSVYIEAQDAEEASEDLKGSFSGIGVTFTMQKDTVNVMSTVRGGPSEKIGILAGDRIVTANDTSLVGMDTDKVMRRLKGPKDSTVKLGIKRHGCDSLQYFSVVRGEIPVSSIDAAYMVNDRTGYIRVKNFGQQTYAEMIIELAKLNVDGMENLVVDLRGNRGGYMFTAIKMANEFLSRDQLIVYTEGRKSPREEFRADGRGSFQKMPVIVLIDEGSASASEIFAGAIQDNDRGTIIGRRSFGKGLVQQPIEFGDGSMVRLTIARYYTPSGRCIQKPYEKGKGEEYEMDLMARYERGEFFSQDSIKQTGEQFTTASGRVVYGGGGIMPDIFVPEDTTGITSYYKEAVYTGLLRQFAFQYSDTNRDKLNSFQKIQQMEQYLKSQKLLDQFAAFGDHHGLKRRNLLMEKSRRLMERNLHGNIIYNVKTMNEYLRFLNEDDPTVLKAIEALEKK